MRTLNLIRWVAAAGGALSVAGCIPAAHKPSEESPQALGRTAQWNLTELNGKPVVHTPRAPWISFNLEKGRVHGFSGCNRFMGAIVAGEGNHIHFTKIASTRMACPNMEGESEFLRMLGDVKSFHLAGDTLTLHRLNEARVAQFTADDSQQKGK